MTRRILGSVALVLTVGLFIGCGDSSSKNAEATRPELKTGKSKEKGMPAPPPIEPATK